MDLHCRFFLLFVLISSATSRNFGDELSSGEARKIQELVHNLQQQGANSNHHVSHDHDDPHHLNDHTNTRTHNLVLKHNNIGRSKPVARIGAEDDLQTAALNDVICKSTGKCNVNVDTIVLDKDDPNVNYEEITLDGKNIGKINYNDVMKTSTDGSDKLDNILASIERAFEMKKVGNGPGNGPSHGVQIRCKGKKCQLINGEGRSDKSSTNYLNKLEKSLENHNGKIQRMQDVRCGCGRSDDNGDDMMDEATRSRCGCSVKKKKVTCKKSCRTGERDDSEDDDLTFLRCCKKCSTLQYRTSDGNANVSDDEEADDLAFGRCCKQCGRSDNFRNVIMRIPDSRVDGDSNEDGSDDPKGKISDISDIAKVYPISENLEAIVIDVTDLDDVLKLANNGINFENADPIRDYVRGGREIFMAPKVIPIMKTQNRLLPLTQMQKMKRLNIKKELRRNVKPDVEKYRLPFQLDIEGLGQINP